MKNQIGLGLMSLVFGLAFACKANNASQLRDLPEAPMVDSFNEDLPYNKNLVAAFASSGFDFNVKQDSIKIGSPLRNTISLLSRYGTPTIAKVALHEDESIGLGYFHEALDVARQDPTKDDVVLAPVSGMARLVLDAGEFENPSEVDSYSTSVVIYDVASHILVGLLHVKPAERFKTATGFIAVTKGEPIGTLAKLESSLIPDKPEFRHTHLMLMDFKNRRFIDPSTYLENYRDKSPPVIKELVFYDEHRQRHQKLISGKLDVVVSAYDRDDFSLYQQEIAAMSLVMRDSSGKQIFELKNCSFEDFWFKRNFALRTPQHAINVHPIYQQLPPDSTNIMAKDIYFEHAATNLHVSDKCAIVEDPQGFVEINDSIEFIEAIVSASDHFGNTTTEKFKLNR